jgi:Fe-S cluster assembly protein SufD
MNLASPSLDARRAEALELFRSAGVPHRRIEEWKYSDLRSALDAKTIETTAHAGMGFAIPQPIEVVDFEEGGMPDWIARRLDCVAPAGAMDAAARAFVRSQAVLRVPKGARPDQPLQFDLRTPGHGQVTLFLEAGASLTLLETHHPGWNGLQNISFSIFLGEGAQLVHIRQAPFAGELIAVETISVALERNSQYRAHFANFGARLSRLELNIALQGEGSSAHLSGATVLGDGAHADITTHVDHVKGNTVSTQLFKNVAGGKSRAVYQGKITVAAGANGSDSRQTAKGLLLGERAEIDLKPELEILADDVKCAHGAAVGDLDAESLFYLRSRGIAESEARNLLIRAFLEDAVAEIADETIRAGVWSKVETALAAVVEAT